MKKFAALILALALVLAMATCAVAEEAMRVAMITDYGDITDQSFNQTTYEACKAYCEANNVDFNYFKPAGDSTAERVAMVESAIDEGYNVIVMPGYAFGGTIAGSAGHLSRSQVRRAGRQRRRSGRRRRWRTTCTARSTRKSCAATWPAMRL